MARGSTRNQSTSVKPAAPTPAPEPAPENANSPTLAPTQTPGRATKSGAGATGFTPYPTASRRRKTNCNAERKNLNNGISLRSALARLFGHSWPMFGEVLRASLPVRQRTRGRRRPGARRRRAQAGTRPHQRRRSRARRAGGSTVARTPARPPSPPPPPLVPPRCVLSGVRIDPAAVSDDAGEWVEIFNGDSVPVNLNGWTLADQGTDHATPVSYTHLRAHETVLDLVCRLPLDTTNTYITPQPEPL